LGFQDGRDRTGQEAGSYCFLFFFGNYSIFSLVWIDD
jgi:hypothetical protein